MTRRDEGAPSNRRGPSTVSEEDKATSVAFPDLLHFGVRYFGVGPFRTVARRSGSRY